MYARVFFFYLCADQIIAYSYYACKKLTAGDDYLFCKKKKKKSLSLRQDAMNDFFLFDSSLFEII